MRRTAFLGILVALLSLTVIGTLFAAGENITRYRAGGSGGGTIANGAATVRSAFGQPIAGVVANEKNTLCSGIACGQGVVSDNPITGLQAQNDGPTVLGNPTAFSASVAGGSAISYTWDYGDGNSGSGPGPAHTYTATGRYTATVTASNSAGSQIRQTVVEVSNAVIETRNFEFTPPDITIPQGGRVTWIRTTGVHNVKADDGSFTSGAPSDTWTTYSRTFDAAGAFRYHCELHGTPGGNGMSGLIRVIENNDTPIDGLTAENDGPTVLGAATSLSASISAGTNVSYTWDFGDGSAGSGKAVQHTYTASGEYVAKVTAVNGRGIAVASSTVIVSDAVIEVRNFEFISQTVTIPRGGQVTWVRTGGAHNVKADDGAFEFPDQANDSWSTYTRTFGSAGDYPYHCELHGGPGFGMFGTVRVIETGNPAQEKVYLPLVTNSE